MPEKYFQIEGVATFLQHTGRTTLPDVPPDLSRGRALVCLHGAGGNGAVFADVLEKLAAEHSPVAFDQPAHGRSGGLDSLGEIERMAAFTRALLSRLGAERPVLLGHAMGGAVALQCALDEPDAVGGLVLCATGSRFPGLDDYVEQMRRVTQGKERRPFRREVYSSSSSPDVMRRGFMEELKTDPRAGLGDLLACREWTVAERLGDVRAPALVVVGEDEAAPLREEADRLASGIPGARLVAIPKAGHMIPIEQPDALADAVGAFLTEVAS